MIALKKDPRAAGTRRRQAFGAEAHSAQLLALVKAEPDITLEEIASRLLEMQGERFVPSVLWRFFDRRAIHLQKNRARQRAGSGGRGRAARHLAGPSA